MVEFDQILCVKLAKAVKEHPCLYNHRLPEYSDKHSLETAWELVSKKVGSSVPNCKGKWRNIRTVFSRNIKRGCMGKKRPYYLREVLKFLIPYLKSSDGNVDWSLKPQEESETPLQSYDMIKYEEFEEEETSVEFATLEHSNSLSDEPICSNQSVPTTVQGQPTSSFVKQYATIPHENNKADISTSSEAFTDFCNQHIAPSDTSDSPRKMFLLSLLSDVENMTDGQFRKFRRDVLPLIDNILLYPSTSS